MDFFKRDYLTKEQSEKIASLVNDKPNIACASKVYTCSEGTYKDYMYVKGFHSDELKNIGYEVEYMTYSLTDLLRMLPDTLCIKRSNGESEHIYSHLKHYDGMVVYDNKSVDDLCKVFCSSRNLIEAVYDAIVWVKESRKENSDHCITEGQLHKR